VLNPLGLRVLWQLILQHCCPALVDGTSAFRSPPGGLSLTSAPSHTKSVGSCCCIRVLAQQGLPVLQLCRMRVLCTAGILPVFTPLEATQGHLKHRGCNHGASAVQQSQLAGHACSADNSSPHSLP